MDDLIKEVLKFRDDRNWKQYHTLETLAKSIMIESAELLENFQWSNEAKSMQNVKEEIADILIYTIEMLDLMSLASVDDIIKLIKDKMVLNNKKYPLSSKNNKF